MTVKIESAHEWTDRQGRKYQELHIRIIEEKLSANRNDMFKVVRENSQVGLVRFIGLNHVRYLEKSINPPMSIAVACDSDVRQFIGAELVKL